MIRAAVSSLALILAASSVHAAAPSPAIAAAVADSTRPAADRDRDAARKPAEMLAFAGVKPGMVVVDMLPGGGYFTRLFSDAVGPTGKVVAYVPDETLARFPKALDGLNAIAAEPAHKNVQVEHNPIMAPGPDNVADVVWTSQNYHDLHNMAGVDLVAFNKLVFRSLRPGGVYVVLDHSAPAGSGASATRTLHRIDPATVRQEAEAAGFVFDGESNVLANPADPHTAGVFDPSIRGHTDQFVLRFRKPGGK
jgi:predicted methyltransferase